jgi:hypothetical protein
MYIQWNIVFTSLKSNKRSTTNSFLFNYCVIFGNFDAFHGNNIDPQANWHFWITVVELGIFFSLASLALKILLSLCRNDVSVLMGKILVLLFSKEQYSFHESTSGSAITRGRGFDIFQSAFLSYYSGSRLMWLLYLLTFRPKSLFIPYFCRFSYLTIWLCHQFYFLISIPLGYFNCTYICIS